MSGDRPRRLLSISLTPHSPADRERLDAAMSKLMADDPTIDVGSNSETEGVTIFAGGEQQLTSAIALPEPDDDVER